MNGGGENDRLEGGAGDDILKGGAGADVFVLDADFGTDTILDLDLSEDRLEISAALANGRSAAEIEDLAQRFGDDTHIDFGRDAVLRLLDLSDVTGLASQIDFV